MIDLNARMHESVAKVRSYGYWVSYGGLLVMLVSVLTFIIEFMRLIHISKLPGIKGSHDDPQQLEDQLN